MRLCSAIATCLIVVQTATTFSAAFAGPGHDGNFDTGWRFLRTDRNDLACVTVEVVARDGNRVPSATIRSAGAGQNLATN